MGSRKTSPKRSATVTTVAHHQYNPQMVEDPVHVNPIAQNIFILANALAIPASYILGNYLLNSSNSEIGAPKVKPGVHMAAAAAANNNGTAASLSSASPCAGLELEFIPDYLIAILPFFFLLMGLEWVLIKVTGLKSQGAQYTAIDWWSSLASGLQQIIVQEVFMRYFSVRDAYCTIYNKTHVFSLPDTFLSYFLAWLLDDFMYYWLHRIVHTHLWNAHYVHHSSERFNLSTALRQTGLQAIVGAMPRLLFAPFIAPKFVYASTIWVTISQFWFHTCVVRKCHPIIEYFINTPSHHRVHHTRRVHANFGGGLIIWDRIFGTFRSEEWVLVDEHGLPENEELCYFGSHDEVHSWTDSATQTQFLKEHCLKYPRNLIVGPGRFSATRQVAHPAVLDEPRIRQKDTSPGWLTSIYLITGFMNGLVAGVWLLKFAPESLSVHGFALQVACVIAALYAQGCVADGECALAAIVEVARIAFVLLYSGTDNAPPGTVHSTMGSIVWIAAVWRFNIVPRQTAAEREASQQVHEQLSKRKTKTH